MSALPPKADIPRRYLDVRFGPQADILHDLNSSRLQKCESQNRPLGGKAACTGLQEPSARIDKPYACMVPIPHKTAYDPFITDTRNGVSG
jgi:hypothetical protein